MAANRGISSRLATLVCVFCLALAVLAPAAFASDGTFVRKFGTAATLNGPSEVVVDSSGNAFVADTNNNRIKKFNSAGTLLATYGASGSGTPAVGGVPQFNGLRDIALDPSGDLYVTDMTNNRVQRLSNTGTYISEITGLNRPRCVATDSSGNVYVTDTESHRICKYDNTGALVTAWGSLGTGNGQFNMPVGISVEPGYVYVTDYNNNRVQKFTTAGVYVTKWGSSGTADGQFGFPTGIDADSAGYVYVADRNNERVQKFTSTGTFVWKWGETGTGDGQFAADTNGIRGITAVAGEGVYVTDYGNNRIQVFGSSAPAVAFTSPAPGTVSGIVPIEATATDPQGISRIDFYVDGVLLSSDSSSPYTAAWDSGMFIALPHTIEARAYDTAGIVGTDSVVVQRHVVSTPASSTWSLLVTAIVGIGLVALVRRRSIQ